MNSPSLCTFILVWLLTQLCSAGKGPPRILLTYKQKIVVREGKTVKIICPVTAEKPPLLQWQKDKETIHAGWERFRMKKNFLKIKDVTMEDAGNYICQATNGWGSRTVNMTLVVTAAKNASTDGSMHPNKDVNGGIAPRFIQPSKMIKKRIQRPVASTIRFKCKATGKPKPYILWYKDGHELTSSSIDIHKNTRWTLKLTDLKKEDTGQYTCKVVNSVGSINYTYDLDVIDKIRHKKPVLIPPHPLNTTVQAGETASFQCKVKSDVQPHIQWLKRVENPESKNLNTTIDVKGQKFVVLKTGEVWPRNDGSYINKLIIKPARVSDSGMYICLGANTMGYSFRSAFLVVLPDPDAPKYPPTNEINENVQSDYFSHSVTNVAGPSLPLVIALPSSVIVIVVAIAIVYLQRKKKCNKPNKAVVRQHKLSQEKHQFVPLPQNPPQGTNDQSRTNSDNFQVRTAQYSDGHSDVPSLPRVQHQHQHLHIDC